MKPDWPPVGFSSEVNMRVKGNSKTASPDLTTHLVTCPSSSTGATTTNTTSLNQCTCSVHPGSKWWWWCDRLLQQIPSVHLCFAAPFQIPSDVSVRGKTQTTSKELIIHLVTSSSSATTTTAANTNATTAASSTSWRPPPLLSINGTAAIVDGRKSLL